MTTFSSARLCALVAAFAVIAPAAAQAAAPAPSTGGANSVTSTSAVLTGSVNPNNEATTYHFEYGPTNAYGTTTPEQGPTAANKQKANVNAAISGLTAGATYHFRLVATNASGTKASGDKTFKTGAGITLVATPGTITLGKQSVLSGQLTSSSPGGIKVTLEQDPAPYNVAEFKNVMTATTDATGKFTFAQAPTANTAYRVTTRNPDAASSVVTVKVRLRVTMTLSTTRPKAGGFVTFRGSVTPARNGQLVRIQKLVSRHWRTVTTTLLAASTDPAVSTYKKRLRIRKKGTYRAYMSGDVMNVAGASARRTIRVH
jgi:hypothetical protein